MHDEGRPNTDYTGLGDPAPTGPNIPSNTPYCWELADRVAITHSDLDFPALETLTFRPHKFKPGGTFTWDLVDGSVCYKITGQTAGGYPYSYYVPSGCPCDPSVDATCVNVQL